MFIATIDAGTSNTRSRIWKDNRIVSEISAAVGVRNTAIDGNNGHLIATIRDTLYEAAEKAGIAVADIGLILAAGMLTSNVGIIEIPHVVAPVSMDELASHMVSYTVKAVSDHPIWFVPGIKNLADDAITGDTIGDMDIMRGEETEAAGLLAHISPQGPCVLVLPGSHNKYIALDGQQRVRGCLTTIAGELLHSLTFDTILASSVERSFADTFDQEAFRQGVGCRQRSGFGHAAFMARIMDLFQNYSPVQAQNYLLGMLLEDDLQAIRSSAIFSDWETSEFIVAGKPVMQQAYKSLFDAQGLQVTIVSEEQQRGLSGFGAISLARRHGLCQ